MSDSTSDDDKGYAITVRLPKELHDALKRRAVLTERTVAAIIRLAARHYLRDVGP